MGRRKQKEYTNVEIVDIAHKGLTMGRDESGQMLLVQNAVPGDIVSGNSRRKKKGLPLLYTTSIDKPSQWRQNPKCEHFDLCGGCKWQNLIEEKQLELKEKQVEQAIKRIAKLDGYKTYPIVPSPKSFEFRNKVEFSFSDGVWYSKADEGSDKKAGALGFHPQGRFDKVVDVIHCHLVPEIINEIKNELRNHALELGLTFYNAYEHVGDLRSIVFKINRKNEIMICLVAGVKISEKIDNLIEVLRNNFNQIVSFFFMHNTKLNDSIFDLTPELIYGEDHLVESISDITFHIGPKSFFQTNIYQTEQLYAQVKEWADLKQEDVLYDLYSGLGSIALYLADSVKEVIGIEEVEPAVEDAFKNAELNLIENAHFISGRVEDLVKNGGINKLPRPEKMIVDPPRAGMHGQVVEKILELAPEVIIYVSCNPATQARDLALMKEQYKLEKIRAFDMFPHTSHVESVAKLIKI